MDDVMLLRAAGEAGATSYLCRKAQRFFIEKGEGKNAGSAAA
jgi:hypothetical protein